MNKYEKARSGQVTQIFEVVGDGLGIGYENIREANAPEEAQMRVLIEEMWAKYKPYADPDFCDGFARDLDARFWEMFLGCTLIDAGLELLPTVERAVEGGQPDLCVIDGSRRIWIEAIAPTRGAQGPDQVVGPIPLNQGGGVAPMPVRQARLRTTSVFWTKFCRMQSYLDQGVINPEDGRVIAISASRFALLAPEDPPLIMTSLLPIGNERLIVNPETGEIVEQNFEYAPEIERESGAVPRTALVDPRFSSVSGVLWSRIGIGNMEREVRPLTMVHNPLADVPITQGWGPWDREFVTTQDNSDWVSNDIRAHPAPNA